MVVKDTLFVSLEPEIQKIEAVLREDLQERATVQDALLTEILSYALFSGGKRIRPLLVVIAAKLCGGATDATYKTAVAMEYLHLATLIQDDIIDKSEMRRGQATVHSKYGADAGILAGDYLHALAMEMVGMHAGVAALGVLCSATKGMVNGEFYQIRNFVNAEQSKGEYFKVIEAKTAIFISAAAQIGGITGDGSEQQQKALWTYGHNLGLAFQIIDDILDYQGQQAKTGKVCGIDLLEGKMTLPLLYALERAPKTDRLRLQEILWNETLRQSALPEVTALIEQYEGFVLSRRKAEACVTTALGALEIFSGVAAGQEQVQLLQGIALYTLQREK